jgi:DNA-binding FadR family transcriptional regulator
MRAAGDDVRSLQSLALEFWSVLVDGTDNVAYRLAYNSLRRTYEKCMDLLTGVLEDEMRDLRSYAAIAGAVRRGEAVKVERLARLLTRRGEERLLAAAEALRAGRTPRKRTA